MTFQFDCGCAATLGSCLTTVTHTSALASYTQVAKPMGLANYDLVSFILLEFTRYLSAEHKEQWFS